MSQNIAEMLQQIQVLSPADLGDLACRWDIGPAALKPLLLEELSRREQLYFSFGLNMHLGRLQQRIAASNTQVVGVAKLNNYRVAFDLPKGKNNQTNADAVANLRPELGEVVWGVLYWLPEGQVDRLDTVESALGYQVHVETVEASHIGALKAHFYMLRGRGAVETAPSPEYQNNLLQGALEQGLPTSYIERLRDKLASLPAAL